MSDQAAARESQEYVRTQLADGNPWYVGSHFEWAAQPCARRIYEKRYQYFLSCIERVRRRCGTQVRLLDAGCGDGYWLWRLEGDEALALTGIDYNEVRVKRAREVVKRAEIYHGDLSALQSSDRFDVVLLNQTIEHVEDDEALLVASMDIMRPGGTLILGTPNEGSWLQQRWLRRKNRLAETDHVHFYTEELIRDKIERAGFTIDSVMREVFFVGNYGLYYWLTARDWGFRLLERLTHVCPSQCSDYYFECRKP